MKRINKLSDLNTLSNTNNLMRGYILNLISFFCKQYECSDISEFGAFCILETEEDIKDIGSMGLSRPLSQTTFEYVDLITMETKDESITFVNALVLLSNDFGINIFAEYDLLSDEIKAKMLEEYTEERIKIDVSKSEIYN